MDSPIEDSAEGAFGSSLVFYVVNALFILSLTLVLLSVLVSVCQSPRRCHPRDLFCVIDLDERLDPPTWEGN